MPRTARSPPAVSNLLLPGPSTDLTQTSSEPDIPSVIIEPELRKITTRAKRTRGVDLIPGSEFTQFRIEIKEMLSSWKTEQEVTMSKLVKEVSDLKVQNEKIHKTNVDIEKALEFMNGQYEEMRTKIGILENERSLYNDNILRLEMKVEELQNSSKRSIVEFRNIPQKEKETAADLMSLVSSVGKVVNVEIPSTEVRDIYRGPGKPDMNKAVICELSRVQTKHELLAAVREYNKGRQHSDKLNTELIGVTGKRLPVYISEHLLPSARKLFHQAREFAKQHSYKYCWVVDGKIYLRKDDGMRAVWIRSASILSDLIQHK